MKQKALIIVGIFGLVFALIILNMLSKKNFDESPDNELFPNRSSYNTGGTGTKAFFDLLMETGKNPIRWQEPVSRLKNKVKVFLVIEPPKSLTTEEIAELLDWTFNGGELILIARTKRQSEDFLKSRYWAVEIFPDRFSFQKIDPYDLKLTRDVQAAKPAVPSVYSRGVNAVQPSVLASNFNLLCLVEEKQTSASESKQSNSEEESSEKQGNLREKEAKEKIKNLRDLLIHQSAIPIIHFANDKTNIMVEFPFGSGKIIYLSDPYIVSNAGIKLADNARLATNLVSSSSGVIAFDEYHHGYGSAESALLNYFLQTPIAFVVIQVAIVIFAILFTQSRRFGRPLSASNPNRLSKLEYVSAMAELQESAKAYDLALENIYSSFRRRAARSLGIDLSQIKSHELAQRIAERAGSSTSKVEAIILRCDDIIYGTTTNEKEVIRLVSELREIEQKIGILRKSKTSSI
jgi:hypothetical protein